MGIFEKIYYRSEFDDIPRSKGTNFILRVPFILSANSNIGPIMETEGFIFLHQLMPNLCQVMDLMTSGVRCGFDMSSVHTLCTPYENGANMVVYQSSRKMKPNPIEARL